MRAHHIVTEPVDSAAWQVVVDNREELPVLSPDQAPAFRTTSGSPGTFLAGQSPVFVCPHRVRRHVVKVGPIWCRRALSSGMSLDISWMTRLSESEESKATVPRSSGQSPGPLRQSRPASAPQPQPHNRNPVNFPPICDVSASIPILRYDKVDSLHGTRTSSDTRAAETRGSC